MAETIPYNFDEIYSEVEELFRDKGYDVEEGSNTAQLITAMSYVTSMLNANTSININETLLTLAQKRKNAVKDAEVLGYIPTYNTSFKYTLRLTFDPNKSYNIAKYSKFSGSGYDYYYLGEDIFVETNSAPIDIEVQEGEWKLYTDEDDLTYTVTEDTFNTSVSIPYQNIEENGLEIFLTYTDIYGVNHTNEPWTKYDRLILDKSENTKRKFIRIDDVDLKTPVVYFKYAGLGTTLTEGDIIRANVLISNGDKGELTSIPTSDILGITVAGYGNDENVSNSKATLTGSAEEDIESIRSNASIVNNTASRAVVADDYRAIINTDSLSNDSVTWGGENEYEYNYESTLLGHLYHSIYPASANSSINELFMDETQTEYPAVYKLPDVITQSEIDTNLDTYYLSSTEIQHIEDVIKKYRLPSLKSNNRNPNYMDTTIKINIIKYPTSETRTETRENVKAVIVDYFKTLEKYSSEYFNSNIIKKIDKTLADLSGVEIKTTFEAVLNSKSLLLEGRSDDAYENDIKIYLDIPYKGIISNSQIDVKKLPKIDTLNFINTDKLHVDFDTPHILDPVYVKEPRNIEYDIYVGTVKSGKYCVYNVGGELFIMVHLYVCKNCDSIIIKVGEISNGGTGKLVGGFNVAGTLYDYELPIEYKTTAITANSLNEFKYLDLDYGTPNISFIRNTFLRLNKLIFT